MLSKKLSILILSVVFLFSFILAVASLDLFHRVNLNQFVVIFDETFGNQVKKFDMIFEAELWQRVTNNNLTMQLGILFAIVVGGIVTLAVINKQLSQMTM